MIKELATELDQVTTDIENIQLVITNQVRDLQVKLGEAQARETELRGQIKTVMAEQGIKKFTSELLDITYVAPSTRTIVDSKRMKGENPELWEKYSKVSNVTDSVRITVKEAAAEVH